MDFAICVAKIGKTVGLKGELKIYLETDFIEQFSHNKSFKSKNNQTLTIDYYNHKRGIVKFIGIDDVDSAKKLTNQTLYTTIEDTKENCKLDTNQYFWFDIIGCKIIENNELLGEIIDIDRYGITDYLKVKTSTNLIKNGYPKEFMIPYLYNKFIEDVNIDTKTIISKYAKDILENS